MIENDSNDSSNVASARTEKNQLYWIRMAVLFRKLYTKEPRCISSMYVWPDCIKTCDHAKQPHHLWMYRSDK